MALREEGIKVVLVNSNPATIQTDLDTADVVYLEPLNAETIKKIIEKEKPDGFIATMSGQTGLNLAVELREFLKERKIMVLGTSIETIELAEDREKFRDLLLRIGEPVPASIRVKTLDELGKAVAELGLPVILRPDFNLGGLGTVIVEKRNDIEEMGKACFAISGSGELLVEKSVAGLCEMEYEVIRDSMDNCITICSMENLDPMGIHTGESVVVAPAQTLSDDDHQKLRSAAIKIVRALGVVGACNVQFALNQETGDYFVIEVNPRTSRSSALASKATGYPIARIATKLALGYSLPERVNKITGKSAMFEPALDYVVLKVPKWPFDKLGAENKLGTGMRSTGETMAIGRTFEEAFNKAIRSVEKRFVTKLLSLEEIAQPSESRLFDLLEALKNYSVGEIARVTKINPWFLEKIKNVALTVEKIGSNFDENTLSEAKKQSIPDSVLSKFSGRSTEVIRFMREKQGLQPVFKMVDTCAGEFPALTPYFYSTFESEDEAAEAAGKSLKRKIIILGSGPIRIGQGIEFDYCTVHAVQALKEEGFDAIIINNNPETVSTDFDVSSRLYFEPLTLEDVLNVVKKEAPVEGVVVQFGGQTSINLALPLNENGVRVLGTSVDSIDVTEDRKKFKKLMKELRIPIVESGLAFNKSEALEIASFVGYPLLIRPSYVLGGRAMHLVRSEGELEKRIDAAIDVSEGHPLLIDHFLDDATELDVDLVCDGEKVFIAGIMEQIDEAGIHSGDSACVIPVISLSEKARKKASDYAKKLALALEIKGLCNIQMAVKGDEVFVLEVNPRASRTIPFVSKAIGMPIAKIAAKIQAGVMTLEGFPETVTPSHYCVKMPVFPFNRFPDVDPVVGAEMKSTGEVMGIGKDFDEAFGKAISAVGWKFGKTVFVGECGKWRKILVQKFSDAGLKVFTDSAKTLPLIEKGELSFVVSFNNPAEEELRKKAIQHKLPCVYGAFLALKIAENLGKLEDFSVVSLNDVVLNKVWID
jgi:carbamoyl-phosphate synthase large subunit